LGSIEIIKITKTPLIYSVSRFHLGGLELCLGRLSPPKPPPWQRDCTEHKHTLSAQRRLKITDTNVL